VQSSLENFLKGVCGKLLSEVSRTKKYATTLRNKRNDLRGVRESR